MQRGRRGGLLHNEAGLLVGVSLGADYTSEHEWGIKTIRYYFGMKDDGIGIEKRQVHRLPPLLTWISEKTFSGIFLPSWDKEEPRLEGRIYEEDNHLYGAWDEKSFLAASDQEKEIAELTEIYAAMSKLDLCIWLGGGGIFQNPGLCLAIKSRIAPEHIEAWAKADRDRIQLMKDAEATGIEAKLQAAGKEWFALSPRRDADGSVSFWLNPRHQQQDNYGQFTVEQLEQWIKGEGPIPMKRPEKRNNRRRR